MRSRRRGRGYDGVERGGGGVKSLKLLEYIAREQVPKYDSLELKMVPLITD